MQNAPLQGGREIVLSLKQDQKKLGSPDANVYVRNIPKGTTQGDVYAVFKAFGEILSCKLDVFPDGSSRGFAYVQFEKP